MCNYKLFYLLSMAIRKKAYISLGSWMEIGSSKFTDGIKKLKL